MTMKNFITILLLLVSTSIFSQTRTTEITQNSENLYDVVIKDGTIKQTGQYIKVEDRLEAHGDWTLFSDRTVLTRGVFNRGELVQITVYQDGERKTYTKTEIELNRLKAKIYRLENMLLSSNE